MSWLLAILSGWLLGVLVNLAADSLPFERRLSLPRCPTCTAPRRLLEWSGTVALLLGRNGCPYCARRRGWRPIVVEVISASGVVLLLARYGAGLAGLRTAVVCFSFLLICVTDFEHRLIPHSVSLPSAVLFALLGAIDPRMGAAKSLQGGMAGAVAFFLLYLLGLLFARAVGRARGRALDEVAFGFGDVTLAGLIGLAVGWPGVVIALFFGVLAAGLFSLAYLLWMLLRGRYAAFLPIPYGPFLIAGALFILWGGRSTLERLFL
jgi:leader peptidase (prepilin peptidase) / N-methyltransferase